MPISAIFASPLSRAATRGTAVVLEASPVDAAARLACGPLRVEQPSLGARHRPDRGSATEGWSPEGGTKHVWQHAAHHAALRQKPLIEPELVLGLLIALVLPEHSGAAFLHGPDVDLWRRPASIAAQSLAVLPAKSVLTASHFEYPSCG
jgi:hypothetical protein